MLGYTEQGWSLCNEGQRTRGWSIADKLEFYSIPEPNSGCVLWIGSVIKDGYGRIKLNGRATLAHRAAYELKHGPISPGMVLDHLCRVRCCINPGHLEMVTNKTNSLRGTGQGANNAKKTHCIHGHEYNSGNTYRRPASGNRDCLICIGIRAAAREVRRSAKRAALAV